MEDATRVIDLGRQAARFTIEARPIGYRDSNLMISANSWLEAAQVAGWLVSTSRVPAATVTDTQTGLQAAF